MAVGKRCRDEGFLSPRGVLGDRLDGIYRLLADHGDVLFPDDYFADLYRVSTKGRPTVPARVLATVMVLQSREGLSDYEAVDRLGRDLAWQAAAGVPVGYRPFHQTVLVKLRARLRNSARPKRFLEDVVAVARESGVLSDRARVVDSTPVFDAVATQDTVTQLRAVIRKLLGHLDRTDPDAAGRVRAVLVRDDDYRAPGKPPCDWDDPAARERLVDDLVRDVLAAVAVFDGTEVTDVWLVEHLEFMVLIAGQDVVEGDDGVFRIARQVAPDRVISTVDPEARHGHKSKSRRFDGFKAHIAEDPDGEIITDVVVTPANTADADALADLLGTSEDTGGDGAKPVVYGDAGYGGAEVLERLDEAGYEFVIKVPSPSRREGRWSKADFGVDIDNDTVTCPAGITVAISYGSDGSGAARFGASCKTCPLRELCTTAATGRTITIHRREDILQTQRFTQTTDPAWAADYTGTRPKVERKLAHLTRKPWGGRKGRMRGAARIAGDLIVRAATIDLARLADQGLTRTPNGWAVNPP
jgi:hypothetical protein